MVVSLDCQQLKLFHGCSVYSHTVRVVIAIEKVNKYFRLLLNIPLIELEAALLEFVMPPASVQVLAEHVKVLN